MTKTDLIELLERKFAIQVVLAVKRMPGCSKADVMGDNNRRTKFLRIDEMIEAGIITADEEKRQHQIIKLYLSPKGQELASILDKLYEFSESYPVPNFRPEE